MGIRYRMVPAKDPLDGSTGYRAAILAKDRLHSRHLAARIADGTSVSEEDAAGVLVRLSKILRQELARGMSVTLDGLGTFRITVRTGLVAAAQDFDPRKGIKSRRISFRAAKELRSILPQLEFEQDAA